MALLNLFRSKQEEKAAEPAGFRDLIDGYSIEVMPRTAAKIDDFKALLPKGTRVYIAHIDGTPIEDMVETARRLHEDGFPVMPHFPSRIIPSLAILEDWIKRYRNEAGVDQALLLGGGVSTPAGDFDSSIQLIETGLFDRYGFKRLHVAGHPEGNKDIDKDGSSRIVDEALKFKQAYSERTDAEMAITTQFAFDAKPVIAWAERIAAAGVKLPIHLGIAGPTKLQTLIKFAIACGVGPSLGVLQKRAMDISKLLVPYEPTEVLTDIANYKTAHPESLIEKIHVFPLGGIRASAEWMNEQQTGERNVAP
ncbi:methylenetetrahydrofolate reductase (NADPH) [Neorhizobium galegae]|uniref:methylenetetrahydrofolate reductase n=1 Tax=Neorhizobium galegae TaxID=399 RepID=UPI001AEAB3B7|nr:methylenetetrahydrofolate reductase [Neorhizobium galegae]MBP2562633.1 methylenetetrahydrofolate reductase (NADPH) [Neorhizobium galegae]MDQ0137208.1 methylenetetrahydrofolate reductase (NADPH) [Neorhizobium galegae]